MMSCGRVAEEFDRESAKIAWVSSKRLRTDGVRCEHAFVS